MTTGACLAPGLLPFQRQKLADVIRHIGGVPLGQIAPVFMNADVRAVRALDPNATDLHAEACATIAPVLAKEHAIGIMPAAWCCGFAIGLRLGRKFGRLRQGPQFLERLPQRRIEKLIGMVSAALGPDVEEVAARTWAREAGKTARRYRP